MPTIFYMPKPQQHPEPTFQPVGDPFAGINMVLFDMDDTLLVQNEQRPVNGIERALDKLSALGTITHCAVITNQDGVSVRLEMQSNPNASPEKYQKYPTLIQAQLRVAGAQTLLKNHLRIDPSSYISYAYYNTKRGEWASLPSIAYDQFGQLLDEWSQSWRKPNSGMLLQAMIDAGVSGKTTVMVGDRDEDSLAANGAGTHFLHVNEFILWGQNE